MAADSPAFRFYPKDWLGSMNTRLMGATGRGIHMDMLAHCWMEGHVPDDPEQVAVLCGEQVDTVQKLWPRISKSYRPDPAHPGFLIHPRIEEEREKQREYRQKKVDAGRKGAESKWQKHGTAIGTATDLPMASDGSSFPYSFSSPYSDSLSSPVPKDQNLKFKVYEDGPKDRDIPSIQAFVAGLGEKVAVKEVQDSGDAMEVLHAFFPPIRPGAGVNPAITRWRGRINDNEIGAALRYLRAQTYRNGDGEELTWGQLSEDHCKRVLTASMNAMFNERS